MAAWYKRRRRRKGYAPALDSRGRERLWWAQEGLCPLCSHRLAKSAWSAEAGAEPTVDHVTPKSKRGPNVLGNYLLVHKACNVRKGSREPFACERIWLAAVVERLNDPLRANGARDHIEVAA